MKLIKRERHNLHIFKCSVGHGGHCTSIEDRAGMSYNRGVSH